MPSHGEPEEPESRAALLDCTFQEPSAVAFLIEPLQGRTFDVRGGRSRKAAVGICKRSLQTAPLDGVVRAFHW